MNVAEREGRALELAIAGRIREKRKEKGWTLEKLAEVTGLSKGHLSQIENGEKIPPISTLSKIAFGLGENVVTLISGEEPQQVLRKIDIGRREKRAPINHIEAAPETVYESFGFQKQDRFMHPTIVTMAHTFAPEPMQHSGQEFVFTLEGNYEFYYDGQTYKLKAGDAIYFDSDRPHMGRSLSGKPSKILVVYCNPLKEQ